MTKGINSHKDVYKRQEYVENNLDNQMWRALEEFLPSVDPSVLDLRLNRVRNVGEIELYDTDLQLSMYLTSPCLLYTSWRTH